MFNKIKLALAVSSIGLLFACGGGGGGGGGGGDTVTYSLGGTVTGLASGSQFVLANGADSFTVSSNGTFTFPQALTANGAYAITTATQPIGAVCTVSNSNGSGVTANVSNIRVACSTNTFTVSGTTSGLAAGQQVTLQNNGANPVTVSSNGSFSFSTPVAYNSNYAVTVGTQPTGQTCSVTNGAGSGVTADISNVSVTCLIKSGKVVSTGTTYSLDAAIQVDGKIIVIGERLIARYNLDGTLDGTFGSNGIAAISLANSINATSVAVQADGKILVAGHIISNFTVYDMAVARLNANGVQDNTFGDNGIAIANFGSNSYGWDIALQSDGKIVVAGQLTVDIAMARFNVNGNLDMSFGANGKVVTRIGTNSSAGSSVAIQSDGKILIGGRTLMGTGIFAAAAIRYTSDGSIDLSFGTNGQFFPFTSEVSIQDIKIQSDGKILLVGTNVNGDMASFIIYRCDQNGNLDSSFGAGGVVVTTFDKIVNGFSAALQSDGKILVLGESLVRGVQYDFAMARYGSDGALDQTFGSNGMVQTNFGGADGARKIILQSDGNIVAVGFSDGNFAIGKYISTGSLDKNFGN